MKKKIETVNKKKMKEKHCRKTTNKKTNKKLEIILTCTEPKI